MAKKKKEEIYKQTAPGLFQLQPETQPEPPEEVKNTPSSTTPNKMISNKLPGEREGGGYDPKSGVPYHLYESAKFQREREQRTGKIEETLGAEKLKEQLTTQILTPEDISSQAATSEVLQGLGEKARLGTPLDVLTGQPIGAQEGLAGAGLSQLSNEQLGGATAGTIAAGGLIIGGAAIATSGIPALVASIGGKIAAATGATAGILKTAATGALAFFGIKGALDIKGGEISSMRAEIAKVPGQSSTILSAVQNGGLSAEEGMQRLRDLANSVNQSERAIKQIGIYNIQFRTDKEYLIVMQEIADARANLLERIGGIQNVALSGKPQVNAEQLIYTLQELEKEEK